jgi:hypothetical protein
MSAVGDTGLCECGDFPLISRYPAIVYVIVYKVRLQGSITEEGMSEQRTTWGTGLLEKNTEKYEPLQ